MHVVQSDVTPFTEFAIDGSPVFSATDLRQRSIDSQLEWEVGGTYEQPTRKGSNLKLLSVYNHRDTSNKQSRNLLIATDLDEISRSPSDVLEVEAILRGSYFWPLSSDQTLEVGAEGALNSLDQTIELFFDLDNDGVADQIDIFNPSSKVEELRTELFVNHNWTFNSRWSLASSLIAENSDISQHGGDIDNTRQFRFLKPRADLRFSPHPSDQVRFKVERTVSQLNFTNFVPRFDIREDRFSAGNPDLKPETAWTFETSYEHRLQNDQGVLEARAFYNDIQDRIERVAIDPDGDGGFDSATGNIGDATEYGAEAKFSLRMNKFGVPDLILGGRYLIQNSSVIDPFTGTERKMARPRDYEAELNFRHDVNAWRLSYGGSYAHQGGDNIASEWKEFRTFTRRPEINAFLEKKIWHSIYA